MSRPFHLQGAGRQAVTLSEGVREGTRRQREMLESLLAVSGLVLLRGEGRKYKGFGLGLKGLKWEGRTIGHRLGVEV